VTTTVGATTTSSPASTMVVAPYFFVDEAGHLNRSGPFLLPVAREVDRTVTVARASIKQLLAGPTSGERQAVPSITTSSPGGVRFLGLTIMGDIATIDLSNGFGASDSSPIVVCADRC